jgi:hypothetical protein
MIPSNHENGVREGALQGQNVEGRRDRERAPVDQVAEENVFGGRGKIECREDAEELEHMAVQITDNEEVTSDVKKVRLVVEKLTRVLAEIKRIRRMDRGDRKSVRVRNHGR